MMTYDERESPTMDDIVKSMHKHLFKSGGEINGGLTCNADDSVDFKSRATQGMQVECRHDVMEGAAGDVTDYVTELEYEVATPRLSTPYFEALRQKYPRAFRRRTAVGSQFSDTASVASVLSELSTGVSNVRSVRSYTPRNRRPRVTRNWGNAEIGAGDSTTDSSSHMGLPPRPPTASRPRWKKTENGLVVANGVTSATTGSECDGSELGISGSPRRLKYLRLRKASTNSDASLVNFHNTSIQVGTECDNIENNPTYANTIAYNSDRTSVDNTHHSIHHTQNTHHSSHSTHHSTHVQSESAHVPSACVLREVDLNGSFGSLADTLDDGLSTCDDLTESEARPLHKSRVYNSSLHGSVSSLLSEQVSPMYRKNCKLVKRPIYASTHSLKDSHISVNDVNRGDITIDTDSMQSLRDRLSENRDSWQRLLSKENLPFSGKRRRHASSDDVLSRDGECTNQSAAPNRRQLIKESRRHFASSHKPRNSRSESEVLETNHASQRTQTDTKHQSHYKHAQNTLQQLANPGHNDLHATELERVRQNSDSTRDSAVEMDSPAASEKSTGFHGNQRDTDTTPDPSEYVHKHGHHTSYHDNQHNVNKNVADHKNIENKMAEVSKPEIDDQPDTERTKMRKLVSHFKSSSKSSVPDSTDEHGRLEGDVDLRLELGSLCSDTQESEVNKPGCHTDSAPTVKTSSKDKDCDVDSGLGGRMQTHNSNQVQPAPEGSTSVTSQGSRLSKLRSRGRSSAPMRADHSLQALVSPRGDSSETESVASSSCSWAKSALKSRSPASQSALTSGERRRSASVDGRGGVSPRTKRERVIFEDEVGGDIGRIHRAGSQPVLNSEKTSQLGDNRVRRDFGVEEECKLQDGSDCIAKGHNEPVLASSHKRFHSDQNLTTENMGNASKKQNTASQHVTKDKTDDVHAKRQQTRSGTPSAEMLANALKEHHSNTPIKSQHHSNSPMKTQQGSNVPTSASLPPKPNTESSRSRSKLKQKSKLNKTPSIEMTSDTELANEVSLYTDLMDSGESGTEKKSVLPWKRSKGRYTPSEDMERVQQHMVQSLSRTASWASLYSAGQRGSEQHSTHTGDGGNQRSDSGDLATVEAEGQYAEVDFEGNVTSQVEPVQHGVESQEEQKDPVYAVVQKRARSHSESRAPAPNKMAAQDGGRAPAAHKMAAQDGSRDSESEEESYIKPPVPYRGDVESPGLAGKRDLSGSRGSLVGNWRDSARKNFGKLRKALSMDKLNDSASDNKESSKAGDNKASTSRFKIRKVPSLRGLFGKKDSAGSYEISGPITSTVETPKNFRQLGQIKSIRCDGTHVVELQRPPHGPYGFYMARGTAQYHHGIFVSRLSDGVPQHFFSGLLSIGDEILQINKKSLRDLDLEQIHELLNESSSVELVVLPYASWKET